MPEIYTAQGEPIRLMGTNPEAAVVLADAFGQGAQVLNALEKACAYVEFADHGSAVLDTIGDGDPRSLLHSEFGVLRHALGDEVARRGSEQSDDVGALGIAHALGNVVMRTLPDHEQPLETPILRGAAGMALALRRWSPATVDEWLKGRTKFTLGPIFKWIPNDELMAAAMPETLVALGFSTEDPLYKQAVAQPGQYRSLAKRARKVQLLREEGPGLIDKIADVIVAPDELQKLQPAAQQFGQSRLNPRIVAALRDRRWERMYAGLN